MLLRIYSLALCQQGLDSAWSKSDNLSYTSSHVNIQPFLSQHILSSFLHIHMMVSMLKLHSAFNIRCLYVTRQTRFKFIRRFHNFFITFSSSNASKIERENHTQSRDLHYVESWNYSNSLSTTTFPPHSSHMWCGGGLVLSLSYLDETFVWCFHIF